MSTLDVGRVQEALSEVAYAGLEQMEVFSSIASTNTYLMTQPAPRVGRYRVAIADHQTSGRGRHERRWVSEPGAGLYLSYAYKFAEEPAQLSSLTLAIGVGVIEALQQLGIEGAQLKWPNDIVAEDAKLGGILTEVQASKPPGVSVVTGIGINMDLSGHVDLGVESDWAHHPVDLASISDSLPSREQLAGTLVSSLYQVCKRFATMGLAGFLDEWQVHDWLLDREITVDMGDRQLTGRAAGIADDGALIVETADGEVRVISGSIVMAGPKGAAR